MSPGRCVTLEGYLRQREITAVDVIRMDVEGAELILSSAGRLFATPRRPVMIVEFEERRACVRSLSAAWR